MEHLPDQNGAITIAASTGALTQVVKDKKKKKKKKLSPKERALVIIQYFCRTNFYLNSGKT